MKAEADKGEGWFDKVRAAVHPSFFLPPFKAENLWTP